MDTSKREQRPNPREKANPISVLLFWWTIGLFKKGYGKELNDDDLYSPLKTDTSQHLGNRLERYWQKELKRCSSKKRSPSLLKTIARTFAWEYFVLGLLHLLNELGLRLGQPLLLGALLAYFRPGSDVPLEDAMLYAGALVLCAALSTVFYNHATFGAFHVGMRIRAACCALMYRKSLRLSRTALGETAAGKVVNLLSNDVSRFDMVSIFVHSTWGAPVSALIIGYMLWREGGYSGLGGVAAVFLIVPLQAYTGKLTSMFRLQTAIRTDERVRLMDEIISGVRVIKMYAWEKPFAKLISLVRRSELAAIVKTSYLRGLFMTFNMCTTRIALYCTLVSLALYGTHLSADKVFVFSSYFNILAWSMSGQFVRAIAEIAETLVSIKRLQAFLLLDEFVEATPQRTTRADEDLGKDAVVLRGLSAKWQPDSTDDTLSAVDLRVPKGRLVAVIGQVGAGKSSLLQALLGELPSTAGTCSLSGGVSYACQEPWVFAASVRQNVLFGLPYDAHRYAEVVRVCALQRDLEQFPYGDLTLVGDRGSSLSGGQKARITLARAVYRDADVYLLDDPLSAVDAHVGKHLFMECIGSFLDGKTRILVTHQLQYLKDVDHIVILNNGTVATQGTFEELLGSQADYARMLGESRDEQPEVDRPHTPIAHVLRQISQISQSSARSKSSEKTNEDYAEKEQEEEQVAPLAIAEASSKGKGGKSPFLAYFRSGTNIYVLLALPIMFLMAQAAASGGDYWMAYWTTQEEIRAYYESLEALPVAVMNMSENENETEFLSMSMEPTNSTDPVADLLTTEMGVTVYTVIIVLMFVVALSRAIAFYTTCMKCSQRLHDAMFNSVIRTTVRFFDVNPSGRILNRFAKDIGSMDELLPKVILDSCQIILMMLGSLLVTVMVNYLFLVPIIINGGIFWFIRKIYLKTSKNVKRLEGIAKSPVFTHLSATLQGLTTIRAFGAQEILVQEFDKHQDVHSSAWYMFITTSTAFGFSLDVLALIYIGLVTFSFLVFEEAFAGQVGLAITQSMSLTGLLQWGIRQSAEVANQLMSVERVLEYTKLEPEPLLETSPEKRPPPTWPEEGRIEFQGVSLRYVEGEEPVLRDLRLVIRPSQKVGVVGRTGAGKSSLIAALFRLAPVEGAILVDGLDTKNVGLELLRSRISIIPQDPVLFSGTLRRNLDPFEEFPDFVLWKALEDVELKEIFDDAYGLETRVAEGGSNFSVGQRQLVCLARAIIRDDKILLMDEATANVDPQTDALIQSAIRKQFKACTVLTVAHRLNTVIDSDRVLVMDKGSVAEFDHPHLLLQNKKGHFYRMVQETGRSMADQLARAAEESYHANS